MKLQQSVKLFWSLFNYRAKQIPTSIAANANPIPLIVDERILVVAFLAAL